MGCCGDKRAQLSNVQRTPVASALPDPPAEPVVRENKTRTFEYIGRSNLTVRGAVTGRAYRFARPGDRIEVAADDAFAMMAERDLKPAPRS